MDHGHRCVYCGTRWFCDAGCPLSGPSACGPCRARLGPDTPRRVVELRHSWVLDRLTEHAADRFRRSIGSGLEF